MIVGTVLPILLQLFVRTHSPLRQPRADCVAQADSTLTQFVGQLDRILSSFDLCRESTLVHVRNRLPIAIVWTLVTSLSSAGWTVAFMEGLHLSARNFVALWAVTW